MLEVFAGRRKVRAISKGRVSTAVSLDVAAAPSRTWGNGLWGVVSIYGLLFAAVVIFAATTPFSRKVTVSGELVPSSGVLSITAQREGVIKRVLTRNGQFVQAGRVLFELSVDTHVGEDRRVGSLLAAAVDAKVLAARAQLQADTESDVTSAEDLRVRREGLDQQLALLRKSREIAAEQVQRSQERINSSKPLVDKGYISRIQMQQWQDLLSSTEIALGSLDERIAETNRQRAQLAVEQRQLEAKALESRAKQSSSQADLLSSQASALGQQSVMLTAERAGRITAVRGKTGAPVKPGDTLALLLPKGSSLLVEVWVPSSAIGFVRRGQAASLMIDAFPHETFGTITGTVKEISTAPINPQELPPGTATEPRYQVLIELPAQQVTAYGQRWDLLPGMKVDAVILLERRTVLEWLLDPIRAFRGVQDP
jgi:membrane fusion protein